jgi:hypothetical protein
MASFRKCFLKQDNECVHNMMEHFDILVQKLRSTRMQIIKKARKDKVDQLCGHLGHQT